MFELRCRAKAARLLRSSLFFLLRYFFSGVAMKRIIRKSQI